ncbi:phospholipase A1-like [Daktulosphaira vitifoliae]|uniref:phospholipase A1-like n=1 Tax=Daktulosphaira vitifoliae TaxID=58002 RepID=UPI0021AA8C75|nr:phospholipase A1-like [Daktulosphaira vitifoliae]XP_050533337.1 phospholipase A1-like [Daktulosphaira vitifoliae]XP_050533338.1 phospholipase A1-like [Daktulosphaira vitifoliae]
MISKMCCFRIVQFLILFQIYQISNAKNSSRNIPTSIKHMPDAQLSILDVITSFFFDIRRLDSYSKSDVKFIAFLANKPDEPLEASSVVYDHMKKVIFYTHGFKTADLNDGVNMKNALIEGADDFDCIILVDWRKGSLYDNGFWPTIMKTDYEIAANINVPIVARAIATFIDKYISSNVKLHLIGFSLGGQVSGMAARTLTENTQRIVDRISALDPAGPIFEYSLNTFEVNTNNTLRKTDAKFVDVIHGSRVLGMINEAGHLDMYMDEVECWLPICTHSKTVLVYIASINKCSQITCPTDEFSNSLECKAQNSNELASAGYLAEKYRGRGKHIVTFYLKYFSWTWLKYSTGHCSSILNVNLPAKFRICKHPPNNALECINQPFLTECFENKDYPKSICTINGTILHTMEGMKLVETEDLEPPRVTWAQTYLPTKENNE